MNIMMIGMLSFISNPLVHSTACVPPSFRPLFTATDLSESISRQKKKEMEQEEEGRDGGTAPPEKW